MRRGDARAESWRGLASLRRLSGTRIGERERVVRTCAERRPWRKLGHPVSFVGMGIPAVSRKDTGRATGQPAAQQVRLDAAPAAPAKRFPDFFIVGHPKCGTTALYEMLRRHPEIHMPDEKEPRFFAPEQWSRFRDTVPPERKRLQTLDGYLSLFSAASSEQRIGEATPTYLLSSFAARRIREVQPAARIIAIFREPASFLVSFHLQKVSADNETQRDLRKAMALEETRRQGKRIPRRCHYPPALQYSDHIRYVEQLRRYHDVFPREQVLVLIYDDFRRDNEATVRKVLRFLEVDDTFPIETVETKRLKSVRFLSLHHLANGARIARRGGNRALTSPISRAVNALTPRQMRSERVRGIWRRITYTAPRPPKEEFMLELRRRFKPEVVALSDYLGRDLVTLWGYDDI
jgi:hypothetical protein